MAQRESALFTVTPGSWSGLAVIFLLLAAFFALLNGQKVKTLRANTATPRAPVPAKVSAATRGTTGPQAQGKTAADGKCRTERQQQSSCGCAQNCACVQSGLQFRSVKSRGAQWSGTELRNARVARRDVDWKNSHFFS